MQRLLAERAPGKEVAYDKSRILIHFRIYDPVAPSIDIVPAVGEWIPSELADKSDDELWKLLQHLSNGKL